MMFLLSGKNKRNATCGEEHCGQNRGQRSMGKKGECLMEATFDIKNGQRSSHW